MSGILYVVATPIGNLEDVTYRALRILGEVALIAAEDTRRTARLLQHYSISTPTTSLHEHNERSRLRMLLERLRAGDSIALVSDAGTPVLSDPGGQLVVACHENGIQVVPIPGPSAITALVSVLGPLPRGFSFVGFLPHRSKDRKAALLALAEEPRPVIIFEAPHRIRGLLSDVATTLGDRSVALGRELTKLHEMLAIRPIADWIDDPPKERGEFVLAILPTVEGPASVSDQDLVACFGRETKSTDAGSRREIIRRVAERFGVPPRRVYAAVEGSRSSVE